MDQLDTRVFETKLRTLRDTMKELWPAGTPVRQEATIGVLSELGKEYNKVVARLYEEMALRDVERQLVNLKDFESIGNLLIDTAVSQSKAERGFLLLQTSAAVSATNASVHRVIARGINEEEREKGPSNTVVQYVLARSEPVVAPILQLDARFAATASTTMSDVPREVMAIPIPGETGVMGVLYVDRVGQVGHPAFGERHVRFLVRLAEPVRAAVEKAQLIEQLRQKAATQSSASSPNSASSMENETDLAERMRFLLSLRGQSAEMVQKLLRSGLVKPHQLDRAIQHSRKKNLSITRALLSEKVLEQKEFLRFVQEEMKIPYVSLHNYVVDSKVTGLVPMGICEKYVILPLIKVDSALTVAMMDPLDPFIIETLASSTGCEIRPVVASEEEIMRAISIFHGEGAGGEGAAESSLADTGFLELVTRSNKLLAMLQRKDVAKSNVETSMRELVEVVLESGVRLGASDIHVQPEDTTLRVRYRIDGVLHTVMEIERRYAEAFVSAIKIMAKIDIGERRLPQDGKAVIDVGRRHVDLRVSTLPAATGEKIVIRILDREAVKFDLDTLGFEAQTLRKFKELIRRPNGVMLVTGPTGSGKTTTLYAALQLLNSSDSCLITLEDPVEFTLEQVTQAQVHGRIGFDFATGLRAILRQDPDIIMVGEVRDNETAEITIRAALTGHLVFSTLHTNDSAGAMTRLMDMGIDGFRLGEVILGVMAQRLVRQVCQQCRITRPPDRDQIERLELSHADARANFWIGRGCGMCNQTGYRGRMGIYELLVMTPELRKQVFTTKDPDQFRKVALNQGMRTLRMDAMDKARRGITSLDEVLAITV